MIINNAINSPIPMSLAHGGTGAALTPSVGGIFYSTSSEAAILGNTPIAHQGILSHSSAAPSWSTVTYPVTTTANRLLYSSSSNVIGGLATAPSAFLGTDISHVPAWSGAMDDGQVIIGSTGVTPTASNLTAGTNLTIQNAPGAVTINSIGNWQWISTQTASGGAFLHFDNQFSSSYSSYRIVLVNLLLTGTTPQLYLQFGIGSTPTYISSGYIYQLSDISSDGANLDYPGSDGSSFNQVFLTFGNNFGSSTDSTFGGICGNVDLFVKSGSSNVAKGISHTSYMSYSFAANYCNTTCAFQVPANNFTSVQLFTTAGHRIASGTAYLYGVNP